jgi:hypothetical protein
MEFLAYRFAVPDCFLQDCVKSKVYDSSTFNSDDLTINLVLCSGDPKEVVQHLNDILFIAAA